MLKELSIGAVLGTCAAVMGCATIVHGGPRAVSVSSTPAGAKVSIYDRSNTLVQTNATPFVAQLPTKYSYFKGQSYRLVFESPDYQTAEVTLKPQLSGWYLGNVVFGGLIGMLIVDPLTGAVLKPQRPQFTGGVWKMPLPVTDYPLIVTDRTIAT